MYCCCHWLMAICLTLYTTLFLFIGILLLVIENIFYKEMDKICNGTSSYSSIKDAFSKLYTSADNIYCVSSSSSGCYCYTKTAIVCASCSRTYYHIWCCLVLSFHSPLRICQNFRIWQLKFIINLSKKILIINYFKINLLTFSSFLIQTEIIKQCTCYFLKIKLWSDSFSKTVN